MYLQQKKNKMKNKDISKLLSLVLRHKPEALGIQLDEQGWTDVNTLLDKMKAKGMQVDFDKLEEVVITNDKQRFSFNDELTKIRANQGHSVDVDLQLKPVEPLEKLFHGTVEKFLPEIKQTGLKKMSRQHVHLSKDLETAVKVGSRRGKPYILTVDSAQMHRDGFPFYLSVNGVWLCDEVPAKYIKFE